MQIRLQKRIAESGHCSRRKAEELISAGKVKVNGKSITELGVKVSEEDQIQVGRKVLKFNNEKITVMLHKPEDTLCSKSDPHHNKTVMDLLPPELQHLKPVGRLDKDSEGLLLLSSDGELIQKLTHPKHEHRKHYEVLSKGYVQDANLAVLQKGKFKLDGYQLNPMDVKITRRTKDRKTWLDIILNEGRNRQIRRVMDAIGFPVIYLRRIAIGQLQLGRLKKGAHKVLTEKEIQLALS